MEASECKPDMAELVLNLQKKDADRANQIYWTWNGFQGDSDWASFEALFGGSE